MNRLSAFLCLILALVSTGTVLGQAYITAPGSVCTTLPGNQRYATIQANVTAETVTDTRYTVTPGVPGVDYRVLYGAVNVVQPNAPALVIEFLTANTYTVSATMNTPSGPYTSSAVIAAESCPLPDCPGPDISAIMAGFGEDFGFTTTRMSLDPLRGTSQFTPNNTGILQPGEYTIIDNTATIGNTDWVESLDRSRDTWGGMMVVNADAAHNIFYRRQVDLLCEGAVYTLSAWVKNLDTEAYIKGCGANYSNPSLTFEIVDAATNAVVATYNSNEVCAPLHGNAATFYGWQQVNFKFKVLPNLSSVYVQVRNNGGGGCGNNLAIDEIRFAYCTPNIFSYFDGQEDEESGKHTMCAGSATTLTAKISPRDYFRSPYFIWDYSHDNVNWTTIDGDGPGMYGTDTDTLHFEEGAQLLEGDPINLDTIYFRLKVVEGGNDTSRCAAPSKTLQVVLLPNPKVEVELNEICIGDTAMLLATGGFTEYVWASPLDTTVGEGEPIPVWPTETSYYEVTGYKDYGAGRRCHRTGEATVLVDDRPVLDSVSGPSDICLGDEVTLSIPLPMILYDIQWTPTSDAGVTEITHTPATSGINTYSATVTNGMCVVTATKDIMVRDIPVADAGADTIRQCNDGNFTMAATLAADETGKWSITGPDNGAVIGKDDDPMTPITGLGGGQTVTLVWSVQKASNAACASTDTVVLVNVTAPISSLAGPDQQQCGALDVFTMAANTPPPGATGIWNVAQGTAVIDNDDQFNTTVTVTGIQDAMLTWTISNPACTGKPDTVILHKTSAPAVTLGTIPGVCSNEPVFTLPYTAVSDNPTTFSVAAAATNVMPGFTPTGDSALVSSPLKVAYPAGTPDGTYDFLLTVKNDGPGCTSTQPFSVNVVTASTAPTTVTADRPELCAGGTVTLTLQDGVLGTGADWVWYADTCGGVSIGNGPTLTTTVNQTTTYYVRAETTAGCGNSACASVQVTIVDRPPVVTFAPAPLTVECVQGKDYTTLFGTPEFSHTPYTNMPLNVTYSDRSDVNGCDQTLTRTWTAVDACGFTASASQTITITDKTAPVYTSIKPADTTVNCDGIPAAVDMEAIDSCYGAMTVTPVETREAIAGECSNNYRLRRTWTATDPCGNTNLVQQIINVRELTPPAFTTPAPADVTVECGNLPAPVTLTATSFCSGATVTATSADQRQDIPGNSCTYLVLRTWTAEDDCGNVSTVTQTITVQDTTRPVFTVAPPADVQVTCDNIPAPDNNVTATDNCGSVKITRTQTQEPIDVPGACGSFRLTRIWTATDECGNTNEARQVITVYCDGLPRISLGSDTILCNGESIRLQANGNGITSTQWSDGSTGPFLNVSAAGTYSVTVANKCGTAADEIKINFIACDPKPTFANAFSPNGDGNHDRFRPVVSRGLMLGYQLRIYTRWGQLIYADGDPKKGWDGSLHGGPQANVGTYIWWVTYKKEADGQPIILSGIVNVLR